MPRHIYFVMPENTAPSGGVNVAMEFAEIISEAGRPVSLHYTSADFRYRFFESGVAKTYSPLKRFGHTALRRASSQLVSANNVGQSGPASSPNVLSVPSEADALVIPEFWYQEQLKRFPDVPHIVLAQNLEPSIRCVFRPMKESGRVPNGLLGFVTTSQACASLVDALWKGWHHSVPLNLESVGLRFVERKKRRIAYMPRRNAAVVRDIRTLAVEGDPVAGIDFLAIDGVSLREARSLLSESLFFLSTSAIEGFGLPPAEAMATGSIVIGDPAVGGNEFFEPSYCFPVAARDFASLYSTLNMLISEYDQDPTRLDGMRRKASDHILSTYTKEKTTRALLKAFEEIVK